MKNISMLNSDYKHFFNAIGDLLCITNADRIDLGSTKTSGFVKLLGEDICVEHEKGKGEPF